MACFYKMFSRSIGLFVVLGICVTPSAAQEQEYGGLPSPLDTVTVDVEEGLRRVMTGEIPPGPYAGDLVLRAGLLGDAADKESLREIVRRSDSKSYGIGALAIQALYWLGDEQPFFLEVVKEWDTRSTESRRWRYQPQRDDPDYPLYYLARRASFALAADPTPEAIHVLESMMGRPGVAVLSSEASNARSTLHLEREYRALENDSERAIRAVAFAGQGWSDDTRAHAAGAIYSSYAFQTRAPIGWRWLQELSRTNPSAVSDALTARADYVARLAEAALDSRDSSLDERIRVQEQAEKSRDSFMKYIAAFTSSEVRSLLSIETRNR